MTSLALCLLALALGWLAGRRSLVTGLAAVAGVGYAYGILRANLEQAAAHFIFDAAVLGLYAARLLRPTSAADRARLRGLSQWVVLLTVWPLALFLLPVQDYLIQVVGLRGNVFLVPFLLLGARLGREDVSRLALWLAGFNIVAGGFAVAEFLLGVERFFPYNAVTDIIYRSNDIAGHTAHRIPATFANAAAYAGTMVTSLPFLVGAWAEPQARRWHTTLLGGAIIATIGGVFMGASRSHAVVLFLLLAAATLSGQLRRSARVGWVVILLGIGWIVSGDERLQRFTTLKDPDLVAERVSGSVNLHFLELASTYPLGNGLGGGGTSIPYFLQHRLRDPVNMENEYARLLLEQGLPGLALWLAFIAWLYTPRRTVSRAEPWYLGRRLAKLATAAYFGTGLIGVGLLTSVPQSALLLLSAGWIAARQKAAAPARLPAVEPRAATTDPAGLPARRHA